MNAAERIRAALEKGEHPHRATSANTAEAPPAAAAPEPVPEPSAVPAPSAPVETTLRLLFQTDDERIAPVTTIAEPPAATPAQPEVLEKAEAPVQTAPEPAIGKPVEKPAQSPAGKRVEARIEKPVERPVAAPVRTVEAAEEMEEALRARRKRVPWKWILLTGMLAVAALVALVYRTRWLPQTSTAAPTALLLKVESQDNGLISLRWNAASAPVAEAREGQLRITEEQKPPRTVPMNVAQLSAGRLFYESSAERVQFDLEVVEKSGATIRESVVAGQKPEPTPAETGESTVSAPATPAPAATTPTALNPATEPKPAQPAPRAFTPPTLPKRTVAQEGRLTLMEPAPTLSGGGTTAPIGALLPGKVDIIPPPPSPGAAAAPPASAERVAVGGKLQSAMLLKKVAPIYPQLARTMRIQGVVRFQAVIGKNGQVKDLKVISGPRALEQAAADAVRKWVYRPTMLDGRPVEVSTQIDINFELGD